MIIIIDINNALCKLNALSSKKNKNNINKLIDLMKINQKISKFFNSKTVFASFVLFVISILMTFETIIEFFIEIFKMMQFNNARAIIANEVQ